MWDHSVNVKYHDFKITTLITNKWIDSCDAKLIKAVIINDVENSSAAVIFL